jgi:hypothetical protein
MRRMVAATIALAALAIPSQVVAQNQTYPDDCMRWRKTFNQYFPIKEVPAKDRQALQWVMWRESKCKTLATGFNYQQQRSARDCVSAHWKIYIKTCKHLRPNGRGVDWGLMQVNGGWRTVTINICGRPPETGVLLRPRCNLAVARWLYDNGGLTHWRGQSGASR